MFVLTDHSAVSVDFCDVSIDFEVLLTFLMFLLTLKTIPMFLLTFLLTLKTIPLFLLTFY
jgi:hypothetical protein